jgi:hypothetical protein
MKTVNWCIYIYIYIYIGISNGRGKGGQPNLHTRANLQSHTIMARTPSVPQRLHSTHNSFQYYWPCPIAAARVRARVRSCGICSGQSGTGTGFLRVLRFSLQNIPPTAPHSSQSSGAGTIGQIVDKWTKSQHTQKN